MGSGGHNKKPTALKRREGTLRGDRMGNEPEIPPEVVAREPPDHLDEIAAGFFREYAAVLINNEILTVADYATLEACAVSYSAYRAAYQSMTDAGGLTKFLKSATSSQNIPQFSAFTKALDQFLRYASKLGLNPVDRSRIELDPGEEDPADPIQGMLNLA